LSKADIDLAERQLGIRLPAEYRAFLLRFNGGYFHHWVQFKLPDPPPYNSGGYVNGISGIVQGSNCGSLNLVDDARTIEGYFEYGMLPIGTSGGQSLCLCVTGDHFGSIFLADSDYDPEDGAERFFFAAPDILAFVNMLTIDPEFEKHEETIPVFQAVERGDLPAVRQFLADGGAADSRNAHGHTLLMCAARNRWPKIAGLLVEGGAAVNAFDNDGRTVLHFAAMEGSVDISKLLLAAGAQLNVEDPSGQTPVQAATDALAFRVVNLLIAAGATQ
jgi:hypothetical protein